MSPFSLIRGLSATFKSVLGGSSNSKATITSENGRLKLRLREWDKGVFASELAKHSIYPRNLKEDGNGYIVPSDNLDPLEKGTFQGSKKAATEIYHRIEQRFASYFDITNFDSTIPQPLAREHKQKLFTFQKPGSDNYPPHLDLVPNAIETGIDFLSIFNFMRLLDTGSLLPRIIPNEITDFIHDDPIAGTMAGIEQRNHDIRAAHKDIGEEPNIGDRKDWYTDAVFAQQHFTGPNPTTITLASREWIERFRVSAKVQSNQKVIELLASSSADSFYIQDYSYFRDAIQAAKDSVLISDDGKRFACAAVCLFQLAADGKLHPLAIILDDKGSLENSIVIFNKRLSPSDTSINEATDWAWRYAKLCVQVSDWTRHELTIHLTDTHLVEEVLIVAAHRTLPTEHIVYRLMEPHWLKTLPLNAAARSALVPGFIVDINGMSTRQTYDFILDAYKRFDFTGKYIPNDLASRGFPIKDILTSKKYHNYVYGKNMLLLWSALRRFVATTIKSVYPNDKSILMDTAIQAFSDEMRNPLGGAMASFPELKTVDAVIDMVVMAIHIASPQHTAVNYLQDYYMAFVPNKPGCLSTPLPSSLAQLNGYKEENFVSALPINNARVWLMSSHLPFLLSYAVAEDQTLLNYALSLNKLAKSEQTKSDGQVSKRDPIMDASEALLRDLLDLKETFKQNSKQMDDQTLPYSVMDPAATAISILL